LQEALPEENKENEDMNIEDDLDLGTFGDKKKKKKKKKPLDLEEMMGEEEGADNEGGQHRYVFLEGCQADTWKQTHDAPPGEFL
jgi:hypothetical protein